MSRYISAFYISRCNIGVWVPQYIDISAVSRGPLGTAMVSACPFLSRISRSARTAACRRPFTLLEAALTGQSNIFSPFRSILLLDGLSFKWTYTWLRPSKIGTIFWPLAAIGRDIAGARLCATPRLSSSWMISDSDFDINLRRLLPFLVSGTRCR